MNRAHSGVNVKMFSEMHLPTSGKCSSVIQRQNSLLVLRRLVK
jgi:hypothetical protein